MGRENPPDPIRHFQLNTIIYGTPSASFLAIRCLHQLLLEFEAEYRHTSSISYQELIMLKRQ